MTQQHFTYPMDRFKELEPSLKKWFNIDKDTDIIRKCLFISFTPTQLMNMRIPDEYRGENGNIDIVRYSYDHSDVLPIPINDEVNFDDLEQFFKDYNIEEDTILYDTLLFLSLYNESLKGGFDPALEEAEYDHLQYALGVRPEMLKLYIALQEAAETDTIKIRFGKEKPVEVDSVVPWLRDELKEYLHKFLGVASIGEAKRELLMNYTNKVGAPHNWQINQYAWGIYTMLEETGFISSQTKGNVSRKQAKFIEDFLTGIHLIDVESNIDANNIRSRLTNLIKNYDTIEEITEEMRYKSSPNNNGGRLF